MSNPIEIQSNALIDLFKSSELHVVLRTEHVRLWEQIVGSSRYSPVSYTFMNVDFLFECQKGNGININDYSVIIFWDNKPVAIWPFFLIAGPDTTFSFFDGRIMPPLFSAQTPESVEKQIVKRCLFLVDKLSRYYGISAWKSMESFNNSIGLSLWHIQSKELEATSQLRYEMFIDLSMDISAIKSSFRKSYKSLITSGQKLWKTAVLDKPDRQVWDEFVNLHFIVSGRKTRSDHSWDIHFKSIEEGKSFLVYLRNDSNRMIGGGLFNFTNDEGFYAVAAYDRELFDKPLGHVVQYRAIEELKNRDVGWYKLGVRNFKSDIPEPSAKEISIADFKYGFATHVFPKLLLDHPVTQHKQS